MARTQQFISKNDPAAWAQTAGGRMLLVDFVVVAVIVMFALGISPNTGGHYDGGSGSSHKGGIYSNSATGDHYRKRD